MSHCVPRWDNNHHPNPNPPASTSKATKLTHSRHLDSKIPNSAPEVPMLDYEVAELTWENGQLGLHGLGQPRLSGSSGTLESVVNQATCFFNPSFNDKPLEYFPQGNDLAPWFSNQGAAAAAAVSVSATMTMDAIVPLCFNSNNDKNRAADGGLTLIESCSDGMSSPAGKGERQGLRQVPVVAQDRSTRSEYSANITCTEKDRGTAFTSTSIRSDDNTSSCIPYTDVTGDDHDSVCQSTPFTRDYGGSGENKKKGSRSMKRSRASAIHNQSERKRRDKISQRMKTLQKMVPNSNKIDKASMLDEVIEYLKQLQAQVSMINRMNMPQMMMPMSFNQQALQMSMMSPIGAAMGMNAAAMAADLLHPSAFMPIPPPWDAAQAMMPDPMPAFLACQQSQPMTMDQYRMMAILYQQIQQAHTPNSKS